MKAPTIEFACGCIVSETYVVAMCVEHVNELLRKDREQRELSSERANDLRREIRQVIEGLK